MVSVCHCGRVSLGCLVGGVLSVCVVSAIVKRPVLPSCAIDWRSRKPLYYYFVAFI